MMQETSERAVEKSVTVNVPLERAFEVFTAEIETWWPLRTHAVDTERSETVVMEGRVGGRLYERTPSGEEHLWGTVVAWEPPSRIVYSWHPGRGEETAQEVQVSFEAQGADATRVQIRHTGWEKLGDEMHEAVASYDEGWDAVIARYVEAANAERS
jgi:uncharacterized protein YndB with AHSA1/START domain